ncbi:MAG: sugar phosphate isomerase/epimerase [Chloroflexi bacterium]|nr:sugar phosphate isomerase/epimerase [Chloroflexota bacterium]
MAGRKLAIAATSMGAASPAELVRAAADAGFDGVGLRLYRSPGLTYAFTPLAGNPALMREVRTALADRGLEVFEVLSYYLQPDMDWDGIKASLEAAAELGGKYPLVIGDDPDWARMCASLARLCDMCEPLGLQAAIEAPVYSRVTNTFPICTQLIADTGHPNAVLGLDPFMFGRRGHSVDLLRAVDQRLLPYSQFGDGLLESGVRTAPGKGEAPLADILGALPADAPLSLEWGAPRDQSYSPAEWAKVAYRETHAFLDNQSS